MKNLDGNSFIDEKQKENIIVGYNLNFNMTDLLMKNKKKIL